MYLIALKIFFFQIKFSFLNTYPKSSLITPSLSKKIAGFIILLQKEELVGEKIQKFLGHK